MDILFIRNLLSEGKIKWTTHSLERLGERDISILDVKRCIMSGEIIEEYPFAFPFPSCLIFGFCLSGKQLHVVVGSDNESVYIITAYYPDTSKFEEDLKTRRK